MQWLVVRQMSPGLLMVWDTWPRISKPSVLQFLLAVDSRNSRSKGSFLVYVQCSPASLVDILLVVSHPVSAWSAGRHFVSSSPSAMQISWSGNIDLFTPELRMSQSSWRPRSLQLTVMWYNKHKKTSVSPDDSVRDVDPVRWLRISCTWNIILSSASSCVQLRRGKGE